MIANLKKEVKQVLENWPETRNSDIALTIKIWQMYYQVGEMVAVKDLYELPREDNVKRIRAKFCEEGHVWAFPTDWKIARARKIKENDWRAAMGYTPKASNPTNSIYY